MPKTSLDDVSKSMSEINAAAGQISSTVNRAGDVRSDIGDAVDSFNHLKTSLKAKTSANAGSYGSASLIGKAARNVFEFPVFVSSSVPVDFATATNSLLEQMYASYLQMAISINPVVSEKQAREGSVFDGLRTNTSRYLEYTDMFYAHDACHNVIATSDTVCEFNMITLSDQENRIILEACEYSPLSEFDHFFQEDVTDDDRKKHTRKEVSGAIDETDADGNHMRRKESRPSDADIEDAEEQRQRDRERHEWSRNKETREQSRESREWSKDGREERSDRRAAEKHGWDRADATRRGEKHSWDRNEEERKAARDERDAERLKIDQKRAVYDRNKNAVDTKVKASQILDETKIQKLNTMKPLMMSVNVKVIADKTGTISRPVEYIVGVKTHCRLIKAEVLPDVAEYPLKEMNAISRRAKWRAGEIKFMDYLFSRSDKKQAAYDSKDPNRKWYHRLYTLAHTKGSSYTARKITGSKSMEGLIPNATIIMSKSDVDMIEAEKGIDLLKGSTAKRFCQELFLMALIVIDTDAQSIKVLLPDVNNDFEVHSLASVNKQLATLDTAGTVSREVSKMMRGQ